MSSTESATVAGYSARDTFDDFKRDTRRYGTVVPAQIAKGVSFIYPDDDDEDDSGTYTDFLSSWEFTPTSPAPRTWARKSKLSDIIQPSQAQQLAKEYQECPTGTTEAQKIVQDYHRKRDGNIEVEKSTVVHTAKELPTIPDHRNSTYTLAITDDGRSTIDLEKRPEPTIRLFHHDQGGLAQAQHQGMDMIQAGCCTPVNIRCQRPGCADVLRDLEALKFHIHIHNIGDTSDAMSTVSARSQKTKQTRHARMDLESPPLKIPPKKAHNRSKSSIEIDATSCQSRSTHRTRKSLLKDSSSLPGSRKTSATQVNSSASHTRIKIPPQSRGRHSHRGTQNGLSEAGYNDSIAMVLSRPTSPVPSVQEVLCPNHVGSPSPPASPGWGVREFSRAKSPKRAFSPTRALSPIRDGLRRVLSLECLKDWKCN
ncbi:hypothetical protein K503DRAFT_854618 [Rhizopogon vinicolor AM-OR11-026]|uniref:Uncharacterized protein n=1 Tax=Rhizopogon vinicolor AM-OR11-026 TaxID=1314800 RepID=A0A1B7N9H7_9AGAM|nr:hypothetical protein K503DRAFT_854618 [Rhizopogon vinicolor AM-OR11-026]